MKICMIGVGSELLLGQIANTNAQYLSSVMNQAGHDVLEHIVVGDNAERLKSVLQRTLRSYDCIILTGGLGPTKDDLTKQTVAEVLGKRLEIDEEALLSIEDYFKSQHQEMTPNNRQQALIISGSHVLKNDVGMAPGMLIEHHQQKIVLLPGPPKELKPMVNRYMLPFFNESGHTIFSEVLRFAGIGESKVETVLMDLIETQSNPTIAPLAGSHEVTLRLTANDKNQQECQTRITPVKNIILQRLGQFYYGSNETTLAESVMNQLKHTVAVYDGVTEGALNLKLNEHKHHAHHTLFKGYFLHDTQFIANNDMYTQLYESACFVQSLFNSRDAISILSEKDHVYIGFLTGNTIEVIEMTISERQLRLFERTSNYVMIQWLNHLKKRGEK
ncbi:CinA family nicotinamide mononucleotide deamidase-related protein [Staphylococcus hyicus]|uniref:CinA family nicotinamide mononucleotide deamidase-related protein n=1 Tax=Staphylococcus hyicus TaxID=1284 RepID=UPI002739B246|nr:CinA family nicotinamide mononucleotide deamidase-related protein [Staphylococcus hyicus]MDP4468138.1 CinA family nicotinamide mononucleotide deamidase-related protein [Staphylococcus hyicus]